MTPTRRIAPGGLTNGVPMVYTGFMIRRNVHLTPQQLKKLAELSKQTGLPMAELIRRAIDEYLKKQERE